MKDLKKESLDERIILSIPQNATTFKVPSIKLINALDKRDYRIKDESGGVVTIRQGCYKKEDLEALHVKVKELFLSTYPTIEIHFLSIKPTNELPRGFQSLVLEDIVLSPFRLRKKSGTFLANFKDENGNMRGIYFSFEIGADVAIFRTTSSLMQGKAIEKKDFETIKVPLEKVPLGSLFFIEPRKWIAKFYIKKGNILTKNRLLEKPTIQKGVFVQGILQEKTLSVKIEVQTLSNGNVGDTIRVRARNGKVFNAIIIDKKRVRLR